MKKLLLRQALITMLVWLVYYLAFNHDAETSLEISDSQLVAGVMVALVLFVGATIIMVTAKNTDGRIIFKNTVNMFVIDFAVAGYIGGYMVHELLASHNGMLILLLALFFCLYYLLILLLSKTRQLFLFADIDKRIFIDCLVLQAVVTSAPFILGLLE